MQKLIITLVLMFSVYTSKAQEQTLCIPASTAKAIQEELLIGDSMMAEINDLVKELKLVKKKVDIKDSVIVMKELKEQNYQEQLKNEQVQKKAITAELTSAKEQYAVLAKRFKRYKIKNIITQTVLTGGIGILTYLLIVK